MSDAQKPWLIRRRPSGGRRPREVVHDLVDVTVDGVIRTVHVIVWETGRGPVLYFVELDGDHAGNGDRLVWQLCDRFLDRDRWADAHLLDPCPVFLDFLADEDDVGPHTHVHPVRFVPDPDDGRPRLQRGRRHLAGQIGRTLGADVPIWVHGTATVATARAALADPGRTVSLPDASNWYWHQDRLALALQAGLPQAYPLGWAALAADGARTLTRLLAGHARLPDRGRGWYLAARPRSPQPPEPLRGLLAAAAVPTEHGEAVAQEVMGLQAAAGAMDRDDPRIQVYLSAADKLSHLMFRERVGEIVARGPRSSHLDRARAARRITATATWAGPVVQTWLRTLTPVPDLPAVLRQHRIAALLKYSRLGEEPDPPPWSQARPGEVCAAYLDRTGRYVLVLADADGPDPTPWMCAEWHRGPAAAATWTDDTVLAADRPFRGAPASPVLALTPEGDGAVRADPFPASLVEGGPVRFEFGDHGDHRDAVEHVMRLLLPLALEPDAAAFATQPFVFGTLVDHPGMTLWPALTAPGDALRLRWGAVRAAAEADVAHVRRLLAPGAPPVYRYFAILETASTPLDQLQQVVRQTGTPHGYATEEHIGPDGNWTRSDILAEINRGKSYDEDRLLRPEQVGPCVETVRARWAEHRRASGQ